MAANSISILGSEHCFSELMDLKMGRKKKSRCCSSEESNDENKPLFNVKKAFFSPLQKRCVLRDADKNPICTLLRKIMTMHERWQVFKGESTKSKDSVKRKSILQWGKIKLEVFLANNKAKSVCDFTVTAGFRKKSCSIAVQSFTTTIAEMKKKGGKYKVTLNPNTDSAFIATLIMILSKISCFDKVTSTIFKLVKMIVDPIDITDVILSLSEKLCCSGGGGYRIEEIVM